MFSSLSGKSLMGFGYAKALIFGEYSALHGSPALVTALTPKISVTLTHIKPIHHPSSDAFNNFTSTSFHDQLKRILLSPLKNDDPILDADITLDAHDFFDNCGKKLGIGSSAASVVALIQAKLQIRHELGLPQLSIHEIIQNAIYHHRIVQNQMGSGIDVIASTLGGISLVSHCPNQPEFTTISPDNLPPFVILATHQEAPTVSFITAAQKVQNTKSYQLVIQTLTDICDNLKNYLLNNNYSDFLSQLDQITIHLNTLAQIIDMPILPDIFYKLNPIAKECHVILKTSGAGGGDIFVALSQNIQNIRDFIHHIPDDFGITVLPFQTAPVRYV